MTASSVSAYCGLKSKSFPLAFICEDEDGAEDLAQDLRTLAPLFGQSLAPAALFLESPHSRLTAMERLVRGSQAVVALKKELDAPALSPEQYKRLRRRLVQKEALSRLEVLGALERLGFQGCHFVESPGQYAARGAVLDFYSLEPSRAVRLFFSGAVLDSIRVFDPQTQKTLEFLSETVLAPCKELEPEGLIRDWLPQSSRFLEPFPAEGVSEGRKYQGQVSLFLAEAGRWLEEGRRVCVFSLNPGEQDRLKELLEGKIPLNKLEFFLGPLSSGFEDSRQKLSVVTASQIWGRYYRLRPAEPQSLEAEALGGFKELGEGDFVVHKDYGIGRYVGLRRISVEREPQGAGEKPGEQEYLCLEFKRGDLLYVPLYDFKKIQKYIGAEGKAPALSSLDARSWENVCLRVQESVRQLALDILKREALRRSVPAHSFSQDSHLEQEFGQSFPYQETPDQARAIEEAKQDLRESLPMDRLVVGDVGFGKTEVAMRAIFKCVMGLKQAALLAPTTILADQHFRTLRARFADYPVQLGLLSRFQNPKETKKILENLSRGSCDVVVGTHRLLQKDVRFKELGLVVIDEEHRFGVKDKERLKDLRKGVHVLSLSATPIPRSLHQSLSGLRGISYIQSPPQGRLPITTAVLPFEEELVARAISAELARGGQVYYVHNRVRTLAGRVHFLEKLLPGVRFHMAHGQMSALELEKTMMDFMQKKFDVLAASTIIESGLDIPNVNTLIVENAHEFGLAQLYQLRGRIGREDRRAFCWLLYPDGGKGLEGISSQARKRLSALKEFSSLGSGLRLALRDLEIRGAGELLGHRQHGFLTAVGLEQYCELLEEEVSRLKGKPPKARFQTVLDLKVPALLPEDYLPEESARLEAYKKLLRAQSPRDLEEVRRELEDLCGPVPAEAENLFKMASLRMRLESFRVRSATQTPGRKVRLEFDPEASLSEKTLRGWIEEHGKGLRFLKTQSGEGVEVRVPEGLPVLDFLEKLSKTME